VPLRLAVMGQLRRVVDLGVEDNDERGVSLSIDCPPVATDRRWTAGSPPGRALTAPGPARVGVGIPMTKYGDGRAAEDG
jgi:hypothetical protein